MHPIETWSTQNVAHNLSLLWCTLCHTFYHSPDTWYTSHFHFHVISNTDWLHQWHWCSFGCHIINHTSHVKMPPKDIPSKEVKVFKELANHNASLCFHLTRVEPLWQWTETDYDAKVQMMLSEESIYLPVEKDPAPSLGVWEDDECPAYEFEVVYLTMNCTCNWEAQEAGSLHPWATQGAQAGCLSLSYCVLVALPMYQLS